MTKRIVTRAPRRLTPSASHRPSSAALRKLSPGDRDDLHGRLHRAQYALITAILALENGGVHGEVSGSLRAHVYFPLRDITDALDGKGGRT